MPSPPNNFCALDATSSRRGTAHWDEAWYAEMSREMIAKGDWITVNWNDVPNFHKPPLEFWGTALSFEVLGESEFSARLFSTLCGLGTVFLVTFFVGRQRGVWLGLLAGFLLVSIPEFSRYATAGQLEGPLSLWVTLILFFFGVVSIVPLGNGEWASFSVCADDERSSGRSAPIVQIAYSLLARDFRNFRQKEWWLSFIVGFLIATPWHFINGGFMATFFFEIIFLATSLNSSPTFTQRLIRPVRQLFTDLDFLTANSLGGDGQYWAGRSIATLMLIRHRHDRLFVFSWCWTTVLPVALSFAWAKWNWYLVPIYPGAAILAALAVGHANLLPGRCSWTLTAGLLAILSSGEVFGGRRIGNWREIFIDRPRGLQ